MHKKCVSLILIIFMVFGFTSNSKAYQNPYMYTNEKTGYKAIIDDSAELLSQDENEALLELMKELTEYGNIAFKSISENKYRSSSKYAQNYYKQNFSNESGTVFLIDMSERYIYIYSDGKNYKTITKSRADTITDNVYKYASKKEYFKCATEAYKQMQTILKGGKIAEPMKYVSNGLISIMLALFINFIIFKIATKNNAASFNEQVKECEFMCKHTTPEVKQVGQHREYSPVSSSSGGSSGGGGGGGSSGGGGGHRF